MPAGICPRIWEAKDTGIIGGDERMKEILARVSGRVQGVGYRYFVRDQAERLGVTGWVRNNADGTVTISAAGDYGVLDEFLSLVRAEGDRVIHVDDIDVEWQDRCNSGNGFEIRR